MSNYKTLHKTIKKVEEDIQRYSFNTVVSTLMICVNELISQDCNKREIISDFTILLSPYAPHIAEEVWEKLGNKSSIVTASFPVFDKKYLVEENILYPVSFNGKTRFKMELPTTMNKNKIEEAVMRHETTQKHLIGKDVKKIIIVPNKIINIVIDYGKN